MIMSLALVALIWVLATGPSLDGSGRSDGLSTAHALAMGILVVSATLGAGTLARQRWAQLGLIPVLIFASFQQVPLVSSVAGIALVLVVVDLVVERRS